MLHNLSGFVDVLHVRGMDIANTRIKFDSGSSLCASEACPTVFDTTDETVVAVQGYRHNDSTANELLPPGEDIVLVDRALLEAVFGGVDN
jgi:hypothetical protein